MAIIHKGVNMSEFNQSKYINDFIKESYDTIKVQVPKGQKEIIKEQAKKKGYKSVNEYMKALIKKDLEEAGEKSINVHHNKGVIIGDNGTINMTEE